MNYYCGLCNKKLIFSGEEHPCRSFSNAFWAYSEKEIEEEPETEEEWETEEDAYRSE